MVAGGINSGLFHYTSCRERVFCLLPYPKKEKQMYSKKLKYLFFVVGFAILTLFGCGEDREEPLPDPTDGLFSKEDLVGSWNVVSVNKKR